MMTILDSYDFEDILKALERLNYNSLEAGLRSRSRYIFRFFDRS